MKAKNKYIKTKRYLLKTSPNLETNINLTDMYIKAQISATPTVPINLSSVVTDNTNIKLNNSMQNLSNIQPSEKKKKKNKIGYDNRTQNPIQTIRL